MTKQEIEKYLAKNKNRHLSNKVLHAHPSPVYWSRDYSYEDVEEHYLSNKAISTSVNMYVGIPYCLPTNPPNCGFCLFPTQIYRGEESTRDYLDFVKKEADLYKEYYNNSTIESLYIGGGTPNLLAINDYCRLMGIIEDLFPQMGENIEKTLEGIPQLFNEAKIKAISDSGFNRVSMGVQQVSEELIKYSGRKQTRKQVFDAIECFHKYNLSCNIDLIFAWPEQSIDDMLSDLKEISESGIRHITHYELNIAGRSNFSTRQKKSVPSVGTKIQMYHIAKEYLLDQGYTQKTVYDWEKADTSDTSISKISEKYNYENNLRDFLYEDEPEKTSCMAGLGYAAVNIKPHHASSELTSISSMNHKDLSKYYDDISHDRLPIERAFMHNKEDVRLIWLFQSLQEMKINVSRYKALFNRSLHDDYKEILAALDSEGWLKFQDNELFVIGDGEFYIPMIQSLISKTRTDEIISQQAKAKKYYITSDVLE